MNTKELVIYQTQEGDISMDVLVENDTVWLTQIQMGQLFGKDRRTVNEHIGNIFKEGELEEEVVCRNFRHTTQHGSIKGKTQESSVKIYNLDVIISVGYRVKSKRGTQFRIWANKVLKDYIINGFAVNQKMQLEQYNDLKQTIKLLSNVVRNKEIVLTADEATGLLQVITDYTYALDTLDNYDYQRLEIADTSAQTPFRATYELAIEAIDVLRKKFGGGGLFGNEKDQSFHSSINKKYYCSKSKTTNLLTKTYEIFIFRQ